MDDATEDFKRRIAESIRHELEEDMTHYGRVPQGKLLIDITGNGFVVRYPVAVEKTIPPPPKPNFDDLFQNNPQIQGMLIMLSEVLDKGEDWQEESKVDRIIRKFKEFGKKLEGKEEKPQKFWFIETETAVCKDEADLTKAVMVAKAELERIKLLEKEGKLEPPGVYATARQIGAPYLRPVPPPPMAHPADDEEYL